MITKEKARIIAEQYLAERKRNYTSIVNADKIGFWHNRDILYGKYKNTLMDVFSVRYGQIWGLEEKGMYIIIAADTGEVLYSTSPHGWIEEMEDEA
jgi:hypothetical protein